MLPQSCTKISFIVWNCTFFLLGVTITCCGAYLKCANKTEVEKFWYMCFGDFSIIFGGLENYCADIVLSSGTIIAILSAVALIGVGKNNNSITLLVIFASLTSTIIIIIVGGSILAGVCKDVPELRKSVRNLVRKLVRPGNIQLSYLAKQ